MAIRIKDVMVLEGTLAEEFVCSAEQNALKKTSTLSPMRKKRIQAVMEKSHAFKF